MSSTVNSNDLEDITQKIECTVKARFLLHIHKSATVLV